jgi:hypothetical protein
MRSLVETLIEGLQVITTDFRHSHGKDPKGDGRWGFALGDKGMKAVRSNSAQAESDGDIVWISDNYGAALKAAKAKAKAKGVDVIYVLA